MESHEIEVRPSGARFVAAPGQTILAAALQAGIVLPYGCRNGACGSCKGRVLSGRVRHDKHAAAALGAAESERGYALFCCAHALTDLVIEARVAEALDGLLPHRMPARIEQLSWAAPDVAILALKLPAGERLAYRAGQYVDFLLPSGLRRSYSIATAPGAAGLLEFHIRHMPGGTFTDALFGRGEPAIRERAVLRIEGPLGTFFLREDSDAPIILLAGGTGFAPIKAIAETIFAGQMNRDAPGGRRARRVALYWGARTRAGLYMDALAQRWRREQPNFEYVPVLSEPEAEDAKLRWGGRTGLVHEAVMADFGDLSAFHVYACGAPAMVSAAQRDFVAYRALPATSFFSDAFVSSADLAGAQADDDRD